jgi:dUTP pyrophosphatase
MLRNGVRLFRLDVLSVRLFVSKPFKVRLHYLFKASHLLNDTMALNVTKLVSTAQLPVRATADSAGYDLVSIDNYVVLPGRRVVVSTGISVQLPPGTYGRIAPRSGLAVKHGLDTLAGVIDPDYTGEIKVVLQNLDMQQPFVIRPGYRIAQLILENYTVADVVEIPSENTPLTQRGASGFGSTGYAVTGI